MKPRRHFGQAKPDVPRWRRGQTATAPQIRLSRQQERDLVARLTAGQQGPLARPAAPKAVNRTLATTGAYRFRYQLVPFAWLAGMLAAGLGAHAAHGPWQGTVLGLAAAGAVVLLARHTKGFARKAAQATAALTALWVPALSLLGTVKPLPPLLLACWVCVLVPWLRHYRIRREAPAPAPVKASDYEIWAKLAAKRKWTGHLGMPEEIPGGVRYPIVLDGAETDIGEVLGQPRKIAAAYGKAMTEAYVEPAADGIESKGSLTLLKRGTLEKIREWDGSGIDHDTGMAVIGRYADSTPARIRFYARRDGIRHGLIAGATGAGKALALDTPVPTPGGWTTMGDLRAGDLVYDEAGQSCRVSAAWPVRYERPCYEVEFSDGSVIVADAEHLWLADTRQSRISEANAARKTSGGSRPYRRKPGSEPVVVTTEQMRQNLTVTASGTAYSNYSVRLAAPLSGDDAALPVPPYALGAWLGDGTSSTGTFTSADPEIVAEVTAEIEDAWGLLPADGPPLDEIRSWPSAVPLTQAARALGMAKHQAYAWIKAGKLPLAVVPSSRPMTVTTDSLLAILATRKRVWEVHSQAQPGCSSYRVKGLLVALRNLGTLNNKHIPVTYLRASESQRRALLAGLLDTDGYCAKSGAVEFCNTNERLARDVHHLVSTLGYKATLRSKTARLRGRDCGTVWTVTFTPADKVFRLSRKLARQVTSVRPTAGHRYVTDIRPVPSVPVRCITVDSPNHLYLAGESCIPTHNTYLLDLIVRIALSTGFIVPVILDPQEGQSLPQWRNRLPYAAGVTECMAMLHGLQSGMLDRSRMLATLNWQDEDGFNHEGMDFYDPFTSCVPAVATYGDGRDPEIQLQKLPIVMIIGDEFPVLLTDPKYGAEAVRVTADIGKRGRKTGVSLWPVAQVPSLAELGDQVVRSMLVGGNVVCLRTGDRVSAGMLGLDVDPSSLPRYFPDGNPTYGLGYVVGPDNRQAVARIDLVSAADRRSSPSVPDLEPNFADWLDTSLKAARIYSAKQDRLAVPSGGAPLAAVPQPEEDETAPGGRTAADAILAVLDDADGPLERGEIVKRTKILVVDKWGREKPFSVKAQGNALAKLTQDRKIQKTEHGTYAPVRASLHAVGSSARETTKATGA